MTFRNSSYGKLLVLFLFLRTSRPASVDERRLEATDELQDRKVLLHAESTSSNYQLQARTTGSCPPVLYEGGSTNASFCSLKHCDSDADCMGGKECCYNGCVFTCTESPPQIVFDWDTDDGTILGDITIRGFLMEQRQESEQEFVSVSDNLVELDGGCLLTSEQFLAMQQFKNENTVSECYCDDSTVKCKLKTNIL